MKSIIWGIIILALLFAAFVYGMKFRESHPIKSTIIENSADQLVDQGMKKSKELKDKYIQ